MHVAPLHAGLLRKVVARSVLFGLVLASAAVLLLPGHHLLLGDLPADVGLFDLGVLDAGVLLAGPLSDGLLGLHLVLAAVLDLPVDGLLPGEHAIHVGVLQLAVGHAGLLLAFPALHGLLGLVLGVAAVLHPVRHGVLLGDRPVHVGLHEIVVTVTGVLLAVEVHHGVVHVVAAQPHVSHGVESQLVLAQLAVDVRVLCVAVVVAVVQDPLPFAELVVGLVLGHAAPADQDLPGLVLGDLGVLQVPFLDLALNRALGLPFALPIAVALLAVLQRPEQLAGLLVVAVAESLQQPVLLLPRRPVHVALELSEGSVLQIVVPHLAGVEELLGVRQRNAGQRAQVLDLLVDRRPIVLLVVLEGLEHIHGSGHGVGDRTQRRIADAVIGLSAHGRVGRVVQHAAQRVHAGDGGSHFLHEALEDALRRQLVVVVSVSLEAAQEEACQHTECRVGEGSADCHGREAVGQLCRRRPHIRKSGLVLPCPEIPARPVEFSDGLDQDIQVLVALRFVHGHELHDLALVAQQIAPFRRRVVWLRLPDYIPVRVRHSLPAFLGVDVDSPGLDVFLAHGPHRRRRQRVHGLAPVEQRPAQLRAGDLVPKPSDGRAAVVLDLREFTHAAFAAVTLPKPYRILGELLLGRGAHAGPQSSGQALRHGAPAQLGRCRRDGGEL